MRAITPLIFVTILAAVRWVSLPPEQVRCATPALMEADGRAVLNCHGLGRTLTLRERCVLGLPVEINRMSPSALRSLFGSVSVKRLLTRRHRTGYLCLYGPKEIRSLISDKEWARISQCARCTARP